MSALSLLIRNAGFAPASHVRVELFLPGSVISECCDYPAPPGSFANEVLSSDRNFFDDLFCIDKSSSYEQYADTAARGESAFRPNLIKDNVTSVHGMWPSYDSGDFRADMEELLSGFEFVKTNNGKVVAKVSFDRVRHGAAFAFPCRLLFAGECEVLHYRIRCDELPEAIEGELRSFDSEREK